MTAHDSNPRETVYLGVALLVGVGLIVGCVAMLLRVVFG